MGYSRAMAEAHAFGAKFNPTKEDRALAEAIDKGTLELFPHKAWSLPAEPTWKEDPFKETNWVFQLQTLRWLDPLRREAQRGEARFIDTWLSYAKSWIEANPPGKGVSRYSWADMVDGARSLTFCFALPVIEDLRPEAMPIILDSLEQHGTWLEDPTHIKTGNHALQQHQGLLVLGAVLERPEWVKLARQRCVDMVHVAYDGEGINEEGALQYHHMNFSWWNLIKRRFELSMGSSPADFDRVNRAPEGMAHATRPDGRMELIGDTEEFRMGGVDHPAVRYVHSAGIDGIAPQETVRVFSRGYAFGRSTWGDMTAGFSDASFYSLRFGPQNQIHGHADGMALTYFQNGESFLRDAGKFTYDAGDPMRKYVVSRAAHNSVTVDDRDYDRNAEVRLTSHADAGSSQFYRFEDPGYPGVEITRRLVISLPLKLALVLDDIASDEEVTARQWWHLADSASHRREDGSVFVRSASNRARFFRLDGGTALTVYEGSKSPVQGWYSPNWRERIPNRTIAFESQPATPLMTLVTFDEGAEAAQAELLELDRLDCVAVVVTQGNGQVATAVMGQHWGWASAGRANAEDIAQSIDARRAAQAGEQ